MGFEWALDGGPANAVTSFRYDDLLMADFTPPGPLTSTPGHHTLHVRTIDQQGHRSPAGSYSWTIGDPGVDLGQAPNAPTVTSETYAEDVWTPLAQTAVFDVSAINQNPPVTALTYALDDAPDTSIAGSTAHLTLTSPTAPGVHVLHVSATNARGYSTYDYAFYIGVTPDAVASVTVTPGQASALVSWPAATIGSGGVVAGYTLQLMDGSGAVTDVGSCGSCTSMAVSGIGSTRSYTARVTARSSAGPAPSASSASFAGSSAGSPAICEASSCAAVDAGCTITACDTTAISDDPTYSATYLATDGSSVRAAAAGAAAQIVTRASDGTAGVAGAMVLAGNLDLVVVPPNSTPAEAQSTSPAMPATRTPRGYILRGNNRIDEYRYRSEVGVMEVTKTIRGRKYLVGAVKVQMRQTLNGGTSHRWKIQARVSWHGGDPYDFFFAYNCGINVPKDDDWTCNTHERDADGTWTDDVVRESYGSVNEIHDASFGSSETRFAKFPMVAYRTSYRDGGYSLSTRLYYRGWDIRKRGTPWVMAPVSGTGS